MTIQGALKLLAALSVANAVELHARLARPFLVQMVSHPVRSGCTVVMGATKTATKKKAKTSGGFGGATSAAEAPKGPTTAELLRQSMALYEEFERQSSRSNLDSAQAEADGVEEEKQATESLTKYAITVRSASSKEFSDWVPIAILSIKCGVDHQPGPFVTDAIASNAKVVLEAGSQAYPALRKLNRASIEYAYETLDSFQSHVYDGLQDRPERRAKAAAVLGVEVGASAAEVKKAHRSLMLELHPDRFVGDEQRAAEAQSRLVEVQAAYTEMGGGQGSSSGSWYAAVGGKARVDFSGPISKEKLGPMGKERLGSSMSLELGGWRAAVFPFEPTLSREFIARNVARSA